MTTPMPPPGSHFAKPTKFAAKGAVRDYLKCRMSILAKRESSCRPFRVWVEQELNRRCSRAPRPLSRKAAGSQYASGRSPDLASQTREVSTCRCRRRHSRFQNQ